jgi:hypothetical protein
LHVAYTNTLPPVRFQLFFRHHRSIGCGFIVELNWYQSPTARPARSRERHRHAQRVNKPFASRLTGRKDCHPPPLPIVGPESASIGSWKPPPASDRQNVLFRVAFGQDRTSGACLAGFQLGAQTHETKCATVGPREQCEGYYRPGPGAHGSASEWTIVAGRGQDLQQEGEVPS